MSASMAEVLANHQPSRWRSFTNENEILRCCGQDFGNLTRKPSRDDTAKAWAAFAAHQASVLAANGYGKLEDAWDAGYDADNESWPDCAIPCGACEQCQKEPTANPYRRPE